MEKKPGIKEGIKIQELEKFTKKYRFEVFFCLAFILASFFSFIFFGAAWSIYLTGLGGILGMWLPTRIEKFGHFTLQFIFKQEKITQIVLAVVGLIFSIFLPPLIFFFLGLMGGKDIHIQAAKISKP
jgi:uncharacterized membrane protein YjjP (DUF1212 family)